MSGVREAAVEALAKLPAEALAAHAAAIVGKLGDSDANVRKAAVKTLATLSTEALKPHASGIVGKLEQLSGQESQEAVRLLAAKGKGVKKIVVV